ncbi:putative clathrin assembly protein [Platanthera zijinensis]|uniref:Clathrin assembly protein n=1 Tax=Platanthera zijinensis TaxID=2320716 RepID=A0AAP0BVB5_9ASPA
MASSSIDRAIGSVKDKTSIGLAKLGSSTTLAELEIVVFKATRHDEHPADEKHWERHQVLTHRWSWYAR